MYSWIRNGNQGMGRIQTIACLVMLMMLVGQTCLAQLSSLSEDEMGEFVAQEGVCDIRLPDSCNTDPEIEETRSIANTKKTIVTDDSLKTQIHIIDQSHIFEADYGRLGDGMTPAPADNFYYPQNLHWNP